MVGFSGEIQYNKGGKRMYHFAIHLESSGGF